MVLSTNITPDELSVFLEESDEQIQHLDENIIRLETDAEDSTLLQEIFRAAHTLKGSSATIGHKKMAEVTHAMEGLLDKLRNQQIKPCSQTIDALLSGLDVLKEFRDEIATGNDSGIDIDPILTELKEQTEPFKLAGKKISTSIPIQKVENRTNRSTQISDEAIKSLLLGGKKVYSLKCTVSKLSEWKSVRCLQIVNAIKEIGILIHSEPDMIQIESEQTNENLFAIFESNKQFDEIKLAFKDIDEVEDIVVRNFESDTVNSEDRHTEFNLQQGESAYRVNVKINPDSIWKTVRCQQVINKIRQIGLIKESKPDQEQLDNDLASDSISVLMITGNNPDDIKAKIKEIDEIADISLNIVTDQKPAAVQSIKKNTPDAQIKSVHEKNVNPVQKMDRVESMTQENSNSGDLANSKRETQKTISHEKIEHQTSVRVGVKVLDKLMNIVEELVIDRSRISEASKILENRYQDDLLVTDLHETSNHIVKVINELYQDIMKVRMVPISIIFNKFPRMLRDLAQKQGKNINFSMQGEGTELDRSIIEQINDPLIHLLRNSVDHGIEFQQERIERQKPEKANINLLAYQEEGHIVIKVTDDGRGIDPEKVKTSAIKKGLISEEAANQLSRSEAIDLVFSPGFSTAEKTTDISGRGVGLDIVRTNVEKLNGTVAIATEINKGTTFTIKLPLTVAVFQGLMISSDQSIYIIPLTSVVETLKIKRETIITIIKQEAMQLRDKIIPILRLGEVLNNTSTNTLDDSEYVVIVKGGELTAGILVDKLMEQQEFVIKALGNYLGELKGISGATILGNGETALILDIPTLLKSNMIVKK